MLSQREFEEEIGQVPGAIKRLGVFYPTPRYYDAEIVFFRFTNLTTLNTWVPSDGDELLEPCMFRLDYARHMVRRDEIADMEAAFRLTLL